MEKYKSFVAAEDVNQAVSCLDVLAQSGYPVSRMKRSGNKLKGLSAFREEKAASMYYYIADNRIWDFGGMPYLPDGGQMKGTPIDLWMYFRGVDFIKAVNEMVEEFGLEYLRGGVKGEVRRTGVLGEEGGGFEQFRDPGNVVFVENFCGRPVEQWRTEDEAEGVGPLWRINDYWASQGIDLSLRQEGDVRFEPRVSEVVGVRFGHEYFEKKGIYEETEMAFGAGYWPGGAGMGRGIVFPVFSPGEGVGRKYFLIDYILRTLGGETRFLAPEGMKKSEFLFNLDKIVNPGHRMGRIFDEGARERELMIARNAIEIKRRFGIILVEGFSDVMKLHQEGFPNVVGAMGCNLSEAQAVLLKNRKINPKGVVGLFFDNDGKEGTVKGVEAAVDLLERDSVVVDEKGFERVYEGVEVKVVDYGKVPEGTYENEQNEPEHFGREWLEVLLGQRSVWSNGNGSGIWRVG